MTTQYLLKARFGVLIPFLLLVISSACIPPTVKNYVWISHGLEGETIYSLAIDPMTPTTLYAGVYAEDGGVFKTTDGGRNWNAAKTGLPSVIILALTIDPESPTTLYAATGNRGVFKTTDGGRNWNVANTGLTNSVVEALAIDPITPTTLYAGTSGDGVFKSMDGGANWRAANTNLTNAYVSALAIDPTMPTTIYAGTSDTVFKSTDGARTGAQASLTWLGLISLFVPWRLTRRYRPPFMQEHITAACSKARMAAATGVRLTLASPLPMFSRWRLTRIRQLLSM